jgi:hypothetical protein
LRQSLLFDAGTLVRIKDRFVIIENREGLAALADFEHTYLRPLPISEFMGEEA